LKRIINAATTDIIELKQENEPKQIKGIDDGDGRREGRWMNDANQ